MRASLSCTLLPLLWGTEGWGAEGWGSEDAVCREEAGVSVLTDTVCEGGLMWRVGNRKRAGQPTFMAASLSLTDMGLPSSSGIVAVVSVAGEELWQARVCQCEWMLLLVWKHGRSRTPSDGSLPSTSPLRMVLMCCMLH